MMASMDLTHVEVHGQDILSFVDALGAFASVGTAILQDLKVGTRGADGRYKILPGLWYPLADKIRILEAVRDRVGAVTLRRVGEKIPENAVFPDDIDTIHKAIAAIDIAYHMNHRKHRQLMFDAATGAITEGIGHYGYKAVPKQNRIISVCDNPNLSEYDEGILLAMARRFQIGAKVELDSSQPTRRTGGASCTFVVTW
jgi:hypothetical protein